jgi:hypothetical protein
VEQPGAPEGPTGPTQPEPPTAPSAGAYPLTFSVDYPDRQLNRLTTGLRIFTVIPILIVLAALGGGGNGWGGGAVGTRGVKHRRTGRAIDLVERADDGGERDPLAAVEPGRRVQERAGGRCSRGRGPAGDRLGLP